MKKLFTMLLLCLTVGFASAGNILNESFEYANHDLESPVGWNCNDNSWLCGYLEKDHNRIPHTGNWYAFSNVEDAWMYMPMYLIPSMRYRFTSWAVSDETYQLEFWAGTSPNPDDMHTLLLSATVASGEYEKFTNFVETIPNNCNYIAVHAVGSRGSYLTIDDISRATRPCFLAHRLFSVFSSIIQDMTPLTSPFILPTSSSPISASIRMAS